MGDVLATDTIPAQICTLNNVNKILAWQLVSALELKQGLMYISGIQLFVVINNVTLTGYNIAAPILYRN